jgi:hypothetical protein
MKKQSESFTFSNEYNFLISLYFIIAFAEITAEFFYSNLFVYIFKPLMLPILGLVYWKTSNKKNSLYITSLFFGLLANIYFISTDHDSTIIAVIFYTFYRLITLYIVMKSIRIKNYVPVILGSLPFLAAFTYLSILTLDEILGDIYMYSFQIILTSFLGGFSLSNYIINKSKMNYWLLMSTLLFTFNHFFYIIKIFYLSIFIFQPIVMFFYAFAQFFLLRFILVSEEEKSEKIHY